MNDHSFPKHAIKAFEVTGEYLFSHPISSQPWSVRSQRIAKQRIFEKYLTVDDIMKAAWLQKQSDGKPQTIQSEYTGCAYLNSLLDERSQGLWRSEMQDLAKTLPTVLDYAQEEYGEIPSKPSHRPAVLSLVPPGTIKAGTSTSQYEK